MATQSEITDRVLSFIRAEDGSDSAFDALALELFAYQHEHNEPYRRFCQRRAKTLRTVRRWQDIPPVPINAFKELTLSCCAAEDARYVFMTSGTTQGGVRGKSFHPDVTVYDASMRKNFATRIMGGRAQIPMGILFPTAKMMPNSSLAHYLGLALSHFGTNESAYLFDADGIDMELVISTLERAAVSGQPYALLGASYSFVSTLR